MLKVLWSDFKIKVTQALDLDLGVKSHFSKWGECLKGTQDPPDDTERCVNRPEIEFCFIVVFLVCTNVLLSFDSCNGRHALILVVDKCHIGEQTKSMWLYQYEIIRTRKTLCVWQCVMCVYVIIFRFRPPCGVFDLRQWCGAVCLWLGPCFISCMHIHSHIHTWMTQ